MYETTSQTTTIKSTNIHYLCAGNKNAQPILFLHGASFTAQTWQDLGTLSFCAEQGYYAIAIDLPGFGQSSAMTMDPGNFIKALLENLNCASPIIVSPSMSGQYSLPHVIQHPNLIRGLVAVAPVGIPSFAKIV